VREREDKGGRGRIRLTVILPRGLFLSADPL
jgi:hypothetical protein